MLNVTGPADLQGVQVGEVCWERGEGVASGDVELFESRQLVDGGECWAVVDIQVGEGGQLWKGSEGVASVDREPGEVLQGRDACDPVTLFHKELGKVLKGGRDVRCARARVQGQGLQGWQGSCNLVDGVCASGSIEDEEAQDLELAKRVQHMARAARVFALVLHTVQQNVDGGLGQGHGA